MERKWPWKKKASDKAALERAATAAALESAAAPLVSVGSVPSQENRKKTNYVQITAECYAHLTGLDKQVKTYQEECQALQNQVKTYQEQCQTYENQVETYEEQFQTLENQIEELNEKLSQAWSEVETKERLVKQHAKVAEDAVKGWEKAETEVTALQSQVDSLKLAKRAAEDRATHLDSGLKDYMQQIRKMKDEHAQELQDVIFSKTKQWDKIKHELEIKIANLEQQLLMSEAESAALSRSLQERGNLIVQISEEKSQAEVEIEFLKGKIESCEREVSSLKYELHIASKELQIRTEEKNMSVKSADVANKQYLEGVKKITRLEAECQRLRGLVRKKLPGPAALAQMRSEVDVLGRDCGDVRTRRSPSTTSSPDVNSDSTQKFLKDNEFLTDRLLAMEEEMKMLKEALAKRNSELQASRNECAKSASKLQHLEAQLHRHTTDPLKTKSGRTACSLASLSDADGGLSDSASCADSWTTASASELSRSKKEKFIRPNNSDVNQLELMDDFLEMEKLACTPSGSNGSVTRIDNLDMMSHEVAKMNAASNSKMDESPISKLRTNILAVFGSLSMESDIEQTVERLKSILQNTQPLHSQTSDCVAVEMNCSDPTCNKQCLPERDSTTTQTENFSSQNNSQVLHVINEDIAEAISQIHNFVLSIENAIRAFWASSGDADGLAEMFEKFSLAVDDILHGNQSISELIKELAHILSVANNFRFSVLSDDGETNSTDCVDKAALSENKVTHSHVMKSYPNGHIDIPYSSYSKLLPDRDSSPETDLSTTCLTSDELKELLLEKERLTVKLEETKSQLFEADQLLAEVRSQLAVAERSNSLADTQLKCMAESYGSLEKHAKELEKEVDVLREKTKALEFDIQEEKKNHQGALETCNYLREQMERNRDMSVSSGRETDHSMQQETELAAAAEKLAKCQETIFQLGKQFESLRPQEELLESPRSQERQSLGILQTEKGVVASHLIRTGSDSLTTDIYTDPSSQSNYGATISPKSPTSSSNLPRHRHTMSGSSLSSTPTPEKYARASFGRMFNARRKM